ncbi:MAG TPA: HAD-IA family hydrolase [Vicinamibacterales bacterium]|jgi:phosphoglycolate phosphatase
MLFSLIVFDLDGTLVDSRRDLADAANAVLVECGASPLTEERIGRMVGDGAATLVARVFAACNLAQPVDALQRFLAVYNHQLLHHTRPYPEMARVLATLEQRAALAVLTNKPLAATREILTGLDLATYFPETAVFGGDGPVARKPDPSGLQRLMAMAGAAPHETLMVGDSIVDWRTARAAKSAMCLARYGFGFETFPLEQIESADRLIDAPIDLLAL